MNQRADMNRRAQELIDTIRTSVQTSDPRLCGPGVSVFHQLDSVENGWSKAALAIRRCPRPRRNFRLWARDDFWVLFGNSMRKKVGDDLLLTDFLRVLLPELLRSTITPLAWSKYVEPAPPYLRAGVVPEQGGGRWFRTREAHLRRW